MDLTLPTRLARFRHHLAEAEARCTRQAAHVAVLRRYIRDGALFKRKVTAELGL